MKKIKEEEKGFQADGTDEAKSQRHSKAEVVFLCEEIQTSRETNGRFPTYLLSFGIDGGQVSPQP